MPLVQTSALALLHIAAAVWAVYHILLYKRDPRAAMGWIMVCIFVPFGGSLAYFLFGINRVRSRARNIKRSFLSVQYEAANTRLRDRSDISGSGLKAIGERVTGQPLSNGNQVVMLQNGENAYPEMIAAIKNAREYVLLATYILKTDQVGTEFADALAAATNRGVRVLVLIDGVGEKYSWPRPSRSLRKRGIKVARFLPPRLVPPSIYLNLRNHRKLLVVDQKLAFAGGMNIGDGNVATEQEPRKISDIHFRFRGPVVASLADIFYRDWQFTTGEAHGNENSDEKTVDGSASCRAVPDGPDDEMDALALTIQSAFSCATKSIDIMTPYFLPGRELISSLESAALRGIKVRIVLPEKNNLFYVHWANRNLLAELLQWGIEAYYQPPPFCHSKLLCVDDEYCLVGSANLDSRSLRLNYELGIEIFSKETSAELRAHLQRVVDESSAIRHEDILNRPTLVRLRDSFSGLFSPYL